VEVEVLDQEMLLYKQLILELQAVADQKAVVEAKEIIPLHLPYRDMLEEPEWLQVLLIVLLVVEVALQVLDPMEHQAVVEMVEQEPFPV